MNDYVIYIDTDSLFLNIGKFISDCDIDQDKWENLSDEIKINYILQISKAVEKYVDNQCYEKLQNGIYNSVVPKNEFAIHFKQEIVCKSALFIKKKKYGFHVLNDEGIKKDKIDVTGLEIIRSETPIAFKPILKEVLRLVLEMKSDDDIISFVEKSKKEILNKKPDEISSNISINKFSKYIINGDAIKGTPYHLKGANNYHKLLKILHLENKYQTIGEGNKASVLYVKPNKYNIECLSYLKWPKEFEKNGILPDYQKMIDKFLINKIKTLLTPMNKEKILDINPGFNLFFN